MLQLPSKFAWRVASECGVEARPEAGVTMLGIEGALHLLTSFKHGTSGHRTVRLTP
jgi:hypothetical protein